MRYIDSWLTGLGLEYIIPKLKANGITTPKKLAQLTLRDMYEVGKQQKYAKLRHSNIHNFSFISMQLVLKTQKTERSYTFSFKDYTR